MQNSRPTDLHYLLTIATLIDALIHSIAAVHVVSSAAAPAAAAAATSIVSGDVGPVVFGVTAAAAIAVHWCVTGPIRSMFAAIFSCILLRVDEGFCPDLPRLHSTPVRMQM